MRDFPKRIGQMDHPLARDPRVKRAWTLLQVIDSWVIDRQIEITSIPAPPFGEGPRGERVAQLFRELGLAEVRRDGIGNVLGRLPRGSGPGPETSPGLDPLIVSAHLDTVFPPGTDVIPKRDGDRILAPGISDDGRGLAALLALIRLMVEQDLDPGMPILFVATVGEEGPGDLRGVRHLLASPDDPIRPMGFISLDGVGLEKVIHRGVGSVRLRISVTGPGGHSWTDFGETNPIHLLGKLVAGAQDIPLSTNPRSTLTVARWGGGTSVNSIPQEAWVELDLRSEDGPLLQQIESKLLSLTEEILPGDLRRETHGGGAGLEVDEIGRRPAGSTDHGHPLVRAAQDATRMLGEDPDLIGSSTDANLPMSLGIPAITLGVGGLAGGIHTVDEWYENQKGPEGILRALLTILLFGELGPAANP